VYRQAAKRSIEDTAKRIGRSAIDQGERILEGVIVDAESSGVLRAVLRTLGPIGATIAGTIFPNVLGSGELPSARPDPQPWAKWPESPPQPPQPPQAPPSTPRPIAAPRPVQSVPVPQPIDRPNADELQPVEVTARRLPLPRAQPARRAAPALQASGPGWQLAGALSSLTLPRSFTRLSSLTLPRIQTSPYVSEYTSTITPTLTAPTPTPTPVPLPQSLTAIQTATLGSTPPMLRTRTRTRDCKCEQPKKRKRKRTRKCRARAVVVWASGPRKGKPAGTRCISWENVK